MPQQLATDEAGHVWDVSDPSRPVLVQAAGGGQVGQIMSLPPSTKDTVDLRNAQLSGQRTQQQISREGATAPYDAQKAAADARKAQIDAEKAARDLAAQQATASPAQQRGMASLANDEVLAAIQRAREGVNAGHSSGYWARLGKAPLVGGLIEPQGVIDLGGDLRTVSSRVTLDTLTKLKQMSPTGASGLGSLTEREGDLLRDSVAALNQEQSPDKLLASLAEVERHYRNVSALMNGEDYRDPKVAEKYGIAMQPKGPQEQPNALATGEHRAERDPALKGVNDRIRSMIGSGRSAQEIVAFMNAVQPGLGDQRAADVGAAVRFRGQNPRTPLDQYPVSVENRSVPMSGARQAVNTAAQTPGGTLALNSVNALTANNLARFSDNPALFNAGIDALSRENPKSAFVGTAAGGALAGGALEAALPLRGLAAAKWLRQPIADTIYGGVSSASQGDSALKGAAEGLVGGYIGRKAAGALGGSMRGVTNPDVQGLRALGVDMTPGSILSGEGRFGAKIKAKEDRFAGLPGIGERINQQRRNSFIDMNRAAFGDAVPPTAGNAIGNYAEQGIEDLRGAVRDSYGKALNGRRFDLTEPQLQQDVTGAVQQGLAIPRTGPEFGYAVRQRIDPVMTNQTATGPQMQDVLQGLRDADFGADAMGNAASDAAGNVRTAFTNMINRQAPDVMPQLAQADAGYRKLNILADAVGRAKNTDGIFSPAQLGQSAFNNAKRFNGPITAATTERPFYDLQRMAQNVLPSKVPDSGTAGRIEGSKGVFGTIRSAARDALYGPLYNDRILPALNTALIDRPEWARKAGDVVLKKARIGGLFGAPLLVDYGP